MRVSGRIRNLIKISFTIGLAIEAGYYDASEVNFECYHGSIIRCDALRLWNAHVPAGFVGLAFAGLVLIMWRLK